MFKGILAAVAMVGMLTAVPAEARNYPCSGKKGGVARCSGGKHICKDGSVSQSKRVCSR
ncbi:putative protein YdcA [Hyphomicrobiales bacterium]|nr:putative protein YdcA [Hyphomicrobiales bacterium]